MPQNKKSRKSPAKPPAAGRSAPRAGPAKGSPKKKAAAKPSNQKASDRRTPARRGRGVEDPVAQIQRVIEVMVAAGAVEVELEEAGTKLRVRLKSDVAMPVVPYPAAPAPAVGPHMAGHGMHSHGGTAGGTPPGVAAAAVDDPRRTVFKSPMVGTFYRAAAPDADPYIEVGDRVEPDTTICILEAMKVMNEIKAETTGEVVEVLAQNGEPVEYGQPLFVIRVD